MLGRLWAGGWRDKARAVATMLCPIVGGVGLFLLFWRAGTAVSDGRNTSTSDQLALTGAGLVLVALFVGIVNIVSTPGLEAKPDSSDKDERRDMRTRFRLLWVVGVIGLALPAAMHAAFVLNDDYRRGNATEHCEAGTPAAVAEAGPAGGSPSVTSETPSATTAAGPSTTEGGGTQETAATSPAGDAIALEVDLGYERNVRTEFVELQVIGESGAGEITPSQFRVIASDSRGSSDFLCVADVNEVAPNRALAQVVIDATDRSPLEGGTLAGRLVYDGPLDLVSREIDVDASLQSRAVYYLLALVPVIVLLAIYPVFEYWPVNLKRWWTSVLIVGAPVVAAFVAAGLRDPTWSISATSLGKLLAGAYGAGAAAAVAAKNAGHDLGTPPTQ